MALWETTFSNNIRLPKWIRANGITNNPLDTNHYHLSTGGVALHITAPVNAAFVGLQNNGIWSSGVSSWETNLTGMAKLGGDGIASTYLGLMFVFHPHFSIGDGIEQGVYIVRSRGIGGTETYIFGYTYGQSRNNTTIASVAGSSQDHVRFRLQRTALNRFKATFRAFYSLDDGNNWIEVGTATEITPPYGDLSAPHHVLVGTLGAGQGWEASVDYFGTSDDLQVYPNFSTQVPSDDFADGLIDTNIYARYHPEQVTYDTVLSESGGALTFTTNGGIGDTGDSGGAYYMGTKHNGIHLPWRFGPEADLSVQADMSPTGGTAAETCNMWMILGKPAASDWIYNTGNGNHTWMLSNGVWAGWYTDWFHAGAEFHFACGHGSTVIYDGAVGVGGAARPRALIKITRVGSVWTWYYDGVQQGATWDDATGIFNDVDLSFARSGWYSNGAPLNGVIYDIAVTGDYDVRDIPPDMFLQNINPANGASGVSCLTDVSFDIVSDGYVLQDSLNFYVNGDSVYDGYSWVASYSVSTITWGTYDGYDGYHVVAISSTPYLNGINNIRVFGQSAEGASLDETFGFVAENFNIESISISPYEETLKIVFTNDITIDTALMSCANYKLTNGAYVYNIEVLSSDTIRLWTKLLWGHPSYRLTISNITNITTQSLEVNYADFSIEVSTANIGSYNGKIETWRTSNFIAKDSQRVYLAGARGLDIFYRASSTNLRKWAQVFDGYNITALSVANFGGDLEITDVGAPYLLNRTPNADAVLLATTNTILLSIADAASSVDLTSVIISVNDNTWFDGTNGGWADGYTGIVTVYPQQLDFIIIGPYFSMDTQNTVSVTASDLSGNVLTTSYIFYVLTEGGFGFGMFGLDPFGGIT